MIRSVTANDCKAIADIYNNFVLNSTATFEIVPLSYNEMRARIETLSESYPYFVCELDGEIAGYCYAHAWKDRAAYSKTLETTVYIAEKFQGRGIGTALISQLIDECRARGVEVLVACITAENQASCAIHRKLGFKQASFFEKVGIKFGRHLDVVDFTLHLTEPALT
ncbi:MAG: GNAT family N-acetyltransferase [Muribaculaceae bacterium]|nr:GNAT family N-acetyltransferase [Muribaculaceae bacterium]